MEGIVKMHSKQCLKITKICRGFQFSSMSSYPKVRLFLLETVLLQKNATSPTKQNSTPT